jgi:hypothetical protein
MWVIFIIFICLFLSLLLPIFTKLIYYLYLYLYDSYNNIEEAKIIPLPQAKETDLSVNIYVSEIFVKEVDIIN